MTVTKSQVPEGMLSWLRIEFEPMSVAAGEQLWISFNESTAGGNSYGFNTANSYLDGAWLLSATGPDTGQDLGFILDIVPVGDG